MIEKYGSEYKVTESSFSDYQTNMKIDPVLRFVGFCVKKKEDQSEEEYEAILSYIVRLFYSVRGTKRVFDYISRYLGIRFAGDPIYTSKSISFSIDNNTSSYDVSLFNTYLIEFLDTLLYYENLGYKVDWNLDITGEEELYCGMNIMTYKLYKL